MSAWLTCCSSSNERKHLSLSTVHVGTSGISTTRVLGESPPSVPASLIYDFYVWMIWLHPLLLLFVSVAVYAGLSHCICAEKDRFINVTHGITNPFTNPNHLCPSVLLLYTVVMRCCCCCFFSKCFCNMESPVKIWNTRHIHMLMSNQPVTSVWGGYAYFPPLKPIVSCPSMGNSLKTASLDFQASILWDHAPASQSIRMDFGGPHASSQRFTVFL